jgi:ATP-binding cassette, subfamily C (CFTR/MRP), member 1
MTIIACALVSFKIARLAGKRQRVWMQAIQRRVDETANMLGSMKAVKMLGLEQHLATIIQGLRVREIGQAKKFRNVIVYSLGLCELDAHKLGAY